MKMWRAPDSRFAKMSQMRSTLNCLAFGQVMGQLSPLSTSAPVSNWDHENLVFGRAWRSPSTMKSARSL